MKRYAFIVCLFLLLPDYVFAKDAFYSTLNINASTGAGFLSGKVLSREHDLTPDREIYGNAGVGHYMVQFALWTDITPFKPVEFGTTNGSSLNFGLRARYGFCDYIQSTDSLAGGGASSESENINTRYLTFHYFAVGPVIRWAPRQIRRESGTKSVIVLTLFTQAGLIFHGTMRPMPIEQKTHAIAGKRSKVTGIRFMTGFGLEGPGFTLFHSGVNFFHAYNRIRMKPNYYGNFPSRTTIHEYGIEVYAGASLF